MKISSDAIRAFNSGVRPSFNPAVNIRDRCGTEEEHAVLRRIHHAKYGAAGRGKLTRKDWTEYAYVLELGKMELADVVFERLIEGVFEDFHFIGKRKHGANPFPIYLFMRGRMKEET
ncbi:hypothetical protein IJ21_31980 [Paenibacillus sp. 32O-W]|nr:hypothetical protein IJ21_31980 [Paenibacillus sp. 32O-W]